MSSADQLLELMFSWMEQRENCAEKLKKLADELEKIRADCNAAEVASSTASIFGSLTTIGAGLATFFTLGAAAPLLVAGVLISGAGAILDVVTKITEGFLSSSTMKEAEAIEKKSNSIAGDIQKQFELLKEEVSRMYSCSDPDEVDRHVLTAFVAAVGRKEGLTQQIDPRALNHMTQPYFTAGPETTSLQSGMEPLVVTGLTKAAGIFSFFSLTAGGKNSERLISKGTEQLIEKMMSAGLQTAVKGGVRAVGGVVGLAFALPEAIDTWTELIRKNHVTAASRSLRETAIDILKVCKTLREQIDEIRKPLAELVKMRRIIENTNRSSEEKSWLIQSVIARCQNEAVKQWLQQHFGTLALFELVDMFNLLRQKLDEEKGKIDQEDIDIVFVAHGSLEMSMVPACCLLPLPSIKDVVLYSPWNCYIDGDAAFGIAEGFIGLQQRRFDCAQLGCPIPFFLHQPRHLPNRWNSMRAAGIWMIPTIMVTPLNHTDGGWEQFLFLQDLYGEPGRNRVVIPFFLPGGQAVPLVGVTLALSLVLVLYGYKATVHLAACLSRSPGTSLNVDYLLQQYTCTIDGTKMTVSEQMFRYIDTDAEADLYRRFKALFG